MLMVGDKCCGAFRRTGSQIGHFFFLMPKIISDNEGFSSVWSTASAITPRNAAVPGTRMKVAQAVESRVEKAATFPLRGAHTCVCVCVCPSDPAVI